MKVFWSWQSDTPENVGRSFVREALEEAIDQLRSEIAIDEPDRQLHLDHDRKGVPGSPDLANTILQKIRDSSVFIADVTPVGRTPAKKQILNPNVAIEFGYALAEVGDNQILTVLNEAYGGRESLPFDLRHKAGPVMYNLGPNSTNEEREREQQSLIADLRKAIGDCIGLLGSQGDGAKHREIPCKANGSGYFDYGEVLAERQLNGCLLKVAYPRSPLLYLRVIPTKPMRPLKQSEAKDIVYEIKINPLRRNVGSGARWERNKYGAITWSSQEEAEGRRLFTTSQLFLNREVWGLDATLLAGGKVIRPVDLEELFEVATRHYLDVAQRLLGVTPPIIIEAGASGVKDLTIAMRGAYRPRYPSIYQDEIRFRQTLKGLDVAEVNRVLLAVFDSFFDAAGEKRPLNFRGFPPVEVSG